MNSSNTNTINPKACGYGCNTRIYWNNEENAYFEVFTKKKHVCSNRSKSVAPSTSAANKPTYYKKSFAKELKPKMANSLELLQGPIQDIQKKYEILSDIITEMGGKTHGSQSHIMQNNFISLIVYY